MKSASVLVPLSTLAVSLCQTLVFAQAPVILSGGVVPLYSTSTTIQPGEWISIYGTNLAAAPTSWNGDFPTSLDNTSVTINGKAGYLWYVSSGQINLQAPYDTATGTVPVVVKTAAGSATGTVTPGQFAPSFSLLDSKHVTGVILRTDGSGAYGGGTYDIIGPTGSSLGYPTVAAKPGETVELFGVGFGPTSPAVTPGQAYSGAASTASPVTVFINNISVTPAFAGITEAGLYQLNVTIPQGAGSGDLPLLASVGGVQTQSSVVISVQTPVITPQVQSLTLSSANVAGGVPVTATVTLSAPAPSSGASVTLSSNSGNAIVPPAVTVPANSTSTTFTIATTSVGSNQTATISASYGGGSAQASLTITPPGVALFTQLSAAPLTFQPSGYPSSGENALQVTPDAGNATYTCVLTLLGSVGGGITFLQGVPSGQTFTFSSVQSGAFLSVGGSSYKLTAGSLVFTLNQQQAAGSTVLGMLTGTITLTGTPLVGGGPSVTVTGALSGQYAATLP